MKILVLTLVALLLCAGPASAQRRAGNLSPEEITCFRIRNAANAEVRIAEQIGGGIAKMACLSEKRECFADAATEFGLEACGVDKKRSDCYEAFRTCRSTWTSCRGFRSWKPKAKAYAEDVFQEGCVTLALAGCEFKDVLRRNETTRCAPMLP